MLFQEICLMRPVYTFMQYIRGNTNMFTVHWRPETHTWACVNVLSCSEQTNWKTRVCDTHDCDTHDCDTHDCDTYDCDTHDCDTHNCDTHNCDTHTKVKRTCAVVGGPETRTRACQWYQKSRTRGGDFTPCCSALGLRAPAFRRSVVPQMLLVAMLLPLDGIYQVIMFMLLISGNVVDSYLVILLIIHWYS